MESVPQTPDKKYGGYVVALMLIGFIGALLILQAERPEAEPEQTSKWIALSDGTGVTYQQFQNYVMYRKVHSDTHRVFAYIDEEGFVGLAQWNTDCVEGTEIETSRTYTSGKPKMLRCEKKGRLFMHVSWPAGDPVTGGTISTGSR